MITNLDGLTQFLVRWLRDQAKESGTQNGCVGLSGGIDSAVVLALCCRAFPKTVAVLMPCHSSDESVSRSKEVLLQQATAGYCCIGITVPLETAFESITKSVTLPEGADDRFCSSALRSCLRAPTLDYVSKCYDALVYGTGNRDEDEIFRYYQKRGDGAVDNNVLVGLHKSEVRQLAVHLGIPASIVNAVPSADLWGGESQTDESELGLSYDEIEWVTRVEEAHGILAERGSFEPYEDESTGDTYFPGKSVPIGGILDTMPLPEPTESFRQAYADKFTDRQCQIIEKAYYMERASRHKSKTPPGVRRDDLAFFVI